MNKIKKNFLFASYLKCILSFIFKREYAIGNSTDINISRRRFFWNTTDPQCYLKPRQRWKWLSSGYYMLELSCDSGTTQISTFYIDYGSGFNEESSFFLPVKPGQMSKRMVYFPEKVKRIRWDPADVPGFIENPAFRFVPLTKWRAVYHIKAKLIRNIKYLAVSAEQLNGFDKKTLSIMYESLLSRHSSEEGYSGWISQSECSGWEDTQIDRSILFSVILPVYNSPRIWLDAAIDSVLAQTYTNWQLILVDDASTNLDTRNALNHYAEADKRIELIRRSVNGHICSATNDGIDQASGEFVVFLDHDDTLAPQALNELACCIEQNPQARFIYSDEDLMTESGQRETPHFKSGWNPDLLLSHNYITHLACYRSDTLRTLDGVRVGYEGAQDYDLALRALQLLTPQQIVHIPKVLYHWRMVEGSTARDSGAKSYATEAGLRALQDYIQQTGINGIVEHDGSENFYRVHWPLPEVLPSVSIVIPTRDAKPVLEACINSVVRTAGFARLELVIVDNGSQEQDAVAYLNQFEQQGSLDSAAGPVAVTLVRDDGDFNFSRLINAGAEQATGDVLLLLNNDTEAMAPGWLQEMLSHACRADIGCVGAKLLYPDMTIQHAGVILGLGGYAAHSHRGSPRYAPGYFCRAQVVQNLSAVTAACLMVRREVFDQVGGFDESYAVAYNDVDFCLRVMLAGYRNLYTPFAELIHYESKTRGVDITAEKQKRLDSEKAMLLGRWAEILQYDPYYNPNLTRSREDFSLRADGYYEVK